MYESVIEILEDMGYKVEGWDGTLDSFTITTDASHDDIIFALEESNYTWRDSSVHGHTHYFYDVEES